REKIEVEKVVPKTHQKPFARLEKRGLVSTVCDGHVEHILPAWINGSGGCSLAVYHAPSPKGPRKSQSSGEHRSPRTALIARDCGFPIVFLLNPNVRNVRIR